MPQRSNANRGAASGGASATPVTSTSEPGALLRFEGVRENSRVRFYVRKADEALAEIGYTEHGERHVGLVARSHGKPPKAGVLLGTRQYRATQPHFGAGTELLITARLTYRDDSGLGAYDSAITLHGAEVAAASVNVYEPPDFAAFLKEQLAP